MIETTTGKTKSGTIIYVQGSTEKYRKKALIIFLKIYNNGFSTFEQKRAGNLIYYLKSNKQEKYRNGFASSGMVKGSKSNELNIKYNTNRKVIPYVEFSTKSFNNEFAIIHELVHVRKDVVSGKINAKHDERKIDFETIGRISTLGLKKSINPKTPNVGTYYIFKGGKTHSGNVSARKGLHGHELLKLGKSGVIHDRKLLTGSINTNIVGTTAVTRTKKLFPKSFFNQKSFVKK